MESKAPLILKFYSEKGNPYIYDICSNLIFHCPDEMIEILNSYNNKRKEEIINSLKKKYSLKTLERNYHKINSLVKNYKAFFPEQKNDNSNILLKKEDFEKEICNCSQLTLNITEQCNLRCKYCAYSGLYKYNRNHCSKEMSFRIAKKSIDYFFSLISSSIRTEKQPHISISFYGGEPLLKLPLIKQCITYAKLKKNSLKLKQKINFRIATNGTLLNDEMIDYFMKNSVHLQISLDGPKTEHDKFRVFKNNRGSFDIVWKNINKIKERNREYFRNKVSFVAVFTSQSDMIKNHNFFSNKDYFQKNKLIVSRVDSNNTKFYNVYKATPEHKKSYMELHELFCSYLKKNKKDKISPYMKTLFRPYFTLYKNIGHSSLAQKSSYTSTCFPGGMRLFVSTDGNFHICERVNEYFPIGNSKAGIEFKRVKKIYSDYIKQITGKCSRCELAHLCTVCFAQVCEDGKFNGREICKKLRDKLPRDLSTIISILEENKQAFEDELPTR